MAAEGHKWTIHIDYQDGDSFHTYQSHDNIPVVWTDLEKAKAGLKRIRDIHRRIRYDEHPEHWEMLSDYYGPTPDGPVETLPGYVDPKEAYNSISLELDDGTEQRIGMFWNGYFEHLKKAEIVPVIDEKDEGTDMVYEPR